MSVSAECSFSTPPAVQRSELAAVWWRWLGPLIVLVIGGTFLALALMHRPTPMALIPLCGLAAFGPPEEAPFLSGSDMAMSKMLTGMVISPSGDVDRDFVDMMVPHHQGAIEMAVLELRYGQNERLKALAQEVVVTQQQEIAAMRLAVGDPLPPSKPAPIDPRTAAHAAN